MIEPRWLGIAAPGLTRETTALDQYTAAVGTKPTVATWYESWSWKRAFPVAEAERLRLWGVTPQVTWEPWNPDAIDKVNQPAYALARIFTDDPALERPKYDDYIRSWALGIKAWGHPIRLRFAHEMNGTWYPWCEGVNGNQPYDYVQAWWHVRGIFTKLGVRNVEWIWCPQTPYPGLPPLARMFPGDGGVDEVALDGYNWAMTNPWNSFYGVFKQGIAEVTPLTSRPISIGETGCPEAGGDKAAWICDMWRALADCPQVRGVLWFNFNKEAPWAVDSSPSALTAFRDGVTGFLG